MIGSWGRGAGRTSGRARIVGGAAGEGAPGFIVADVQAVVIAIVLVVGRPVAYRPPALPVSVICDDTDVVRVEDAGTFLRMTGLRPGVTSCSFGSATRPGRRAVERVEVRPLR